MSFPKNIVVEMDGKRLVDDDRFHDEFARVFGFPDYYGRNMNAWIDCMSSLDDVDQPMTKFNVEKGRVVTIKISNYEYFKKCAPRQWIDLLECSAFVNFRCTNPGINPLIALAFYD